MACDDLGLLPRLWSTPIGVGAQCKAVMAAVLAEGSEAGGRIVAHFRDVAKAAEVTQRTLRRMRERAEGAPILVWETASVGVDFRTLVRTLRPDAPSENGRSVRTLRPKTDAPSAGTVLDSRAQTSLLASDTTYPQQQPHLPPQGGAAAAAAGLADEGKGNPDPSEQGERIGQRVDNLTPEWRQAVVAVCDEFKRRGGISQRAQMDLASLLGGESVATLHQLAAMLRRGSEYVRSPKAYISRSQAGQPSVLDEARERAAGEAKALAAAEHAERHQDEWRAQQARVKAEMASRTPEQIAATKAKLDALLAAVSEPTGGAK